VLVRAARAVSEGAPVYDTGGPVHHVREVVEAIEAVVPEARITFDDAPFAATPPSFDGRALDRALGRVEWRPLEQGVRETIDRFRSL
jgi:nucleoside-diphosphate-sugar epimerase